MGESVEELCVLKITQEIIFTEAKSILTPKQFKVFSYRYRDELSYQEIALQMNLSVKAVSSLASRALEKLRNSPRVQKLR